MSLLGGLNPVNLLATTALGPVGGIVAQLATQMFSQIGQQLIQQMGQGMGLPQSAIDMAQGSFASASGDIGGAVGNINDTIEDLGRQRGASPAQIGDTQRMVADLILKHGNDAMQTDEAKEAKAGGGKAAGGWLRALAEALGKSADKAADALEQKAGNLDNASPSESAEYSADAEAFSMLMGAINTAIKAIGEALGNNAKRQ